MLSPRRWIGKQYRLKCAYDDRSLSTIAQWILVDEIQWLSFQDSVVLNASAFDDLKSQKSLAQQYLK